MSTKTEKPMCTVCFETYTGSVRKECKCPYCSNSCCVKCLQQYFLNSIEDAHCMHCKTKFSKEILYGFCTKTFVNTTYFHHRQNILLNRSKSFLPDAQIQAEREIEIEKIDNLIKQNKQQQKQLVYEKQLRKCEIENRISQLKLDMAKNKNNGTDHTYEINELKVLLKNVKEEDSGRKLEREWTKLWNRRFNIAHNNIYDDTDDDTDDDIDNPEVAEAIQRSKIEHEKKKFIRRCTNDGCRGFLSTQWKCGLCEHWVCPDCFEVKGTEKNVEHTCKKENIESANLIKKDTKPCPSCGEMIMKIDGCDMMWCTSCHTPFSWNTSTVIKTGYVHNPHYFQWVRASGREVARNPADIPHNGCNNQMNAISDNTYRQIYNVLFRNMSELAVEERQILRDKLEEIHYRFADIRYHQIHNYDAIINRDANEETKKYAVNYIRGRITEEQWKLSLAKYEKKIEKTKEIRAISEAFYAAYVDIMLQVDTTRVYSEEEAISLLHKIFDELDNLRETMMPYLGSVSKNYNCTVPYIDEEWKSYNLHM
jgi:hypothetical protein